MKSFVNANSRLNVITPFLLILLCTAFFASSVFAQKIPVKNVAVIETQIDEHSGAASQISKAEVRVITNEIRREAVKNLPRNRFSVMTSETVMSMGDAVLEDCAEENCVIALGSKIGADYIVRGIISKFTEFFTITIEMYETEYGMLVATAEPVRTENLRELLERSTAVCAQMYKEFLETSLAENAAAPVAELSTQPAPVPAPVPTPAQASAPVPVSIPAATPTPTTTNTFKETSSNANVTSKHLPEQRAAKGEKGSFYFTPRFNPSGAFEGASPWAFDLEAGFYIKNGMFFGIDAGVSYDGDGEKGEYMAGGAALNIGYESSFKDNNLQIAYGGSVGIWWTEKCEYCKEGKSIPFGSYDDDKYGISGPFIRFRWHSIELLYRGLFGFGERETFTSNGDDDGRSTVFSYTNHLMLGYQFRSRKK